MAMIYVYWNEEKGEVPSKYSEDQKKKKFLDFPGGTVHKNLPANAGKMGLIPGLERLHIRKGK